MDSVSSDSLKLKVEPLRITNYYAWSNDMEVVLRGKGIWKYVDPDGHTMANTERDVEQQKADLTLAYILMSIDLSCKSSGMRLRDPLEV